MGPLRSELRVIWERASREGDIDAMDRVIAYGYPVDARDRYSQTALMRAAHYGRLNAIRFLIDRGADLDRSAKYGLTALMLAVISGQQKAASMLIEAGANAGLRGSGVFSGKSAADLAEERGETELAASIRGVQAPT